MKAIEPDWAMRQTGISASDFPAICGVSPHKDPIDVWREKVHPEQIEREDSDNSIDLLRGTCLEPAVIEMFRRKYKLEVEYPIGTMRHPDYPFIMATLDGRTTLPSGEVVNLEVKCPRFTKAGDWCNGEWPRDLDVPYYILPQVIVQMAVAGLQKTLVLALLGDELRVLPVAYDAEFFDNMRKHAERFHKEFVLAKRPPPVDGSEGWSNYLRDLHPRVREDELLLASTRAIEVAKRLDAATVAKKRAEADLALAKNEMKEIIGDTHGVNFGSAGKVTWKNNADSTQIDYLGILADYGIVPNAGDYARHTTTKPGARVFRSVGLKGSNL